MSIERSVRRAQRRQELDREQWADLDKIRYDLLVRTQPDPEANAPCVDPEPTARQWVTDPSFERTLELVGPTPPGFEGTIFWSEIPWWNGDHGPTWRLSGFNAASPYGAPFVSDFSADRSFISTENPRSGLHHVRYHTEFGDSVVANFGWSPNLYPHPCASQALIGSGFGHGRRTRTSAVIAHVQSGQTLEVSYWVHVSPSGGGVGAPFYTLSFRGWPDNLADPSILWAIDDPGFENAVLPLGGYTQVHSTITIPSGHGIHWVGVGLALRFLVGSSGGALDVDMDDWQVWTR